eukprot:TRINITY_DN4645_c0_g1_i2.p1 TRINITY_DN4645_c0_g1~~TRINITY_DN4645_c0_g1_i2.p1  ORF type:complete len:156 (+),score=34.63 TRINITY_DN4645_c0_g1_i2:666-1133(+)
MTEEGLGNYVAVLNEDSDEFINKLVKLIVNYAEDSDAEVAAASYAKLRVQCWLNTAQELGAIVEYFNNGDEGLELFVQEAMTTMLLENVSPKDVVFIKTDVVPGVVQLLMYCHRGLTRVQRIGDTVDEAELNDADKALKERLPAFNETLEAWIED